MQLTWYTADSNLVGDYALRVTGGYSTNTRFFDFMLHVIDPCVTAVRTIDPNQWPDISYDILAPEQTISWTDSIMSVNETICGGWEYEMLFATNSTAISDSGTSIRVDLATKQFKVYSEDHGLSDTYTVIFRAWNTGYEA